MNREQLRTRNFTLLAVAAAAACAAGGYALHLGNVQPKAADASAQEEAVATTKVATDRAVASRANACGIGTPTKVVSGAEVLRAEELQRQLRGTKYLPDGETNDEPNAIDLPPETTYAGSQICAPPYKPRRGADDEDQAKYQAAAAGGPNFAGKYVVIVNGCGMGCSRNELVDVTSGQAYDFPYWAYDESEDREERRHGLTYNFGVTRNTMTARWGIQDENDNVVRCVRQTLRWTGKRFIVVKHQISDEDCGM
jgi:hypothetical protein